jgi:hypothetical protein
MPTHAKKFVKSRAKNTSKGTPRFFFLRSQQVHFERARAATISGRRAQVPIKVLIGKIPSEN